MIAPDSDVEFEEEPFLGERENDVRSGNLSFAERAESLGFSPREIADLKRLYTTNGKENFK